MDNKEIDELIAAHSQRKDYHDREAELSGGSTYHSSLMLLHQKTARALREHKQLKEQGTFEDGLRRAAEILAKRQSGSPSTVERCIIAEDREAILNEAETKTTSVRPELGDIPEEHT